MVQTYTPSTSGAAASIRSVPSGASLVFSLSMRTLLFIVFGFAFVALFAVLGETNPLQAAERWWPFQAILANLATFVVLRKMLRREGIAYRDLFRAPTGEKAFFWRQFGLLVLVGFILGAIPLYLFSALLLGSFVPPDTMLQPLPLWAAVIAVVAFPITNALVETPTYIGYALPRLRERLGSLWMAAAIVGFALAFQHVALPLVEDVPYMLWRLLSFVPLAVALGFIFHRTRRLAPIAAAHGVMDLQLAASVLMVSL
ncbi:CPBP family intramembrane metalloprotease [Paenibacillus sp. TRM 82003]|nr:CPBP family intramembrane metalloprotease [Paenibacillus sp. TRM 82003]